MRSPICQITLNPDNTPRSVTARVNLAGEDFELYIRANQDVLSPNLSGFILAVLLPAMSAGGGVIRAEGEVSPQLIENFPRIQRDYNQWNPNFHPVKLEGIVPGATDPLPGTRTGIFFSGGVDSFYSYLTQREEISDLVFIHGAENKLEYLEYRQRLAANLQETADHYGVNLIQIETNIRDLLDRSFRYGHWGYPVTLGFTGLSLDPSITEMRISVEYFPGVHISGSENLPLWNTPDFSFTLSDFYIPRGEKVGYLASDEFVLQHLHVCHRAPETNLNCGLCEKCIRTMLNLKTHDALERCTTFAVGLEPDHIRRMYLAGNMEREYLKANLAALEKRGGDQQIIKAIKSVLRQPVWILTQLRRLRRIGYQVLRNNRSD